MEWLNIAIVGGHGRSLVATTVGAPSDAELARRSARLRLPTWLAGGSPIEFGRMCRWRMEVAADLAGGEWDVRLRSV